MIPEHIYIARLIELRQAVREAGTRYQLRSRLNRYLFVRDNAMTAHPHLNIDNGIH